MSERSGPIREVFNNVSEHYTNIRRRVGESTTKKLDSMYGNILSSPATVVILLVIIAAFFAQQGMNFQDQIDDDVEIFLPDGAPSTELLMEVREEWSTDITIIYIQSNNADPKLDEKGRPMWVQGEDNITDKAILEEISWVEGDDRNIGGDSISRGIDYDKDDHGRNDGVLWIISPAQIIKEINSADGRFNSSFCENIVDTRDPANIIGFDMPCEMLPPGGEYAIPEQAQIDRIIEESNGSFSALIKDTNDMDPFFDSDGDGDPTNDMDGDGIWDTTAIVVGMSQDFDEMEDFADFKELMAHFENIVDNREDPQLEEMTVTGINKVLEDVSEEIYEDLLMILPWSVLFTIIVITVLHRSLKVVLITGLPIVMALAVTFGTSVILDITLTPMIVATFPILIGLGVDYALHMVNRIEEVRRKELAKIHDENERRRRKGETLNQVPDLWDLDFYKKCVLEMTSSTGVAVLLSAMTTIVGFSVLIAPQIVTVAPIRSVGVTLVIGIASTLIFSIILVPTLAWMSGFHKRSNPSMWKNIGKWPVKGFLVILLISGAVTFGGVMMWSGQMDKSISGSDQTPDNIDSIESLSEYSNYFSGGQTSLFIFSAEQRPNENNTDRIRDLPVLDVIDGLENRIGDVERTNTTSIITFLRTIPVQIGWEAPVVGGTYLYKDSLWNFLHEPCWTSNDPIECNAWILLDASGPGGREQLRKDMVNVVFDTLSDEVLSMLLNEDGTKGIVYVTQPYMNLDYASILRDDIDSMLEEDTGLEGTGASKLTGGLPVSLDINEGIHGAQNLTTIVTMIILTLILSIVFRSPRLGIYTMIPVAVVILWQPILMNSSDVNVNIFTAMIGTIVFGIGVDDSIHVMHRIQEEGETPTGIANSIEETGQTIFETTITTVSGIAAGFLVTFPGLENFFMIMCLLIIFAFITSAFLLPAIITFEHSIRSRIKGEGSWIDYGEGISLASPISMKPLDAVLED
ncbi:MAG: MMPL family transporter [Candidatus Poseidoniaceae archaeon]|nr:MMPL family transporter [Candidatus Poseidoniaceae archaeon]